MDTAYIIGFNGLVSLIFSSASYILVIKKNKNDFINDEINSIEKSITTLKECTNILLELKIDNWEKMVKQLEYKNLMLSIDIIHNRLLNFKEPYITLNNKYMGLTLSVSDILENYQEDKEELYQNFNDSFLYLLKEISRLKHNINT